MYKLPEDKNNDYNNVEYKDDEQKIGIANLYIIPNNNKVNGKEHKTGKNGKR